MCHIDKWNLFLSTNILLFDVLTILIHHFVLFFSILIQKEKFYVKRKKNTQSSCMIFFTFYVGWTHFLRGSLFMKAVSQWIWTIRNLLQCYPVRHVSIRHNYFFKDYPHYILHRFFFLIRRLKVAPVFL